MLASLQQLYIMHLASLMAVAALALRNQLRLRAVLLVSILLNLLDHALALNGPLWNNLVWDAVTLAVNVGVMGQIILDRTHIGLSAEEERLFQAFGSLSPGEFRRIVKLARWATADEVRVLTTEGITPDHLFYILDGEIRLAKAGRETMIAVPTFIGEVAFVKERTASATVTLAPGARYLVWSTTQLRQYFVKKQALRVAMIRLLSADMAMKVARA